MDVIPNGLVPTIPNPTVDLHWDDFKGPVYSFFDNNARQHPDRICVIETATTTVPRREFSYKQIRDASNILANHLRANGIQKGEVVMCYAYRGVDLVIAIMGILKAGAAFSVIDPLYPTDRQIIYLDVAQPRALIVLQKATLEAGPLNEKVTTFIAEHLQLKTEVPALAIQDDGSLRSGLVSNDLDAFQNVGQDQRQSPPVDIGPDDQPTLSFTSGSEGRPKGVAGRHYSLPKYYPWMAERFNLTEKDRFTMLSGIAHDPIQRDVFTPLYLGATLLIPAKDDIMHEKLAQWMQREGATVSHLTPAMGQILVGGASTSIPSLAHVFFVGDLLLKRDCRKLQDLAPNVYIVNMYGTTETQRAVSYYELPSQAQDPQFLDGMPDVIPAGQGMQDVQLLVVNREERTKMCNFDEIGEIYVRAGGLAEGYLGLSDLTAQKFVTNWFTDDWHNKTVGSLTASQSWQATFKSRDRMYRTGDLGKYLPDGTVAVVGRADDQVKIRGFRIELGEIDTHLSRHDLIRENVTLVRRDKDEEPTLVSYFVPEFAKWMEWMKQKHPSKQDSLVPANPQSEEHTLEKRFEATVALRAEIREYLKSKLPSYAVPTVLVPMWALPLTPNGKVDKRALPFPEPSQLRLAARRPTFDQSSLSPTEKIVAAIWAHHLPNVVSARTIAPDDSFFDLGGHSLIAQYVLLDLRKELPGINVPISALFQKPTLRAFGSELDRLADPIGLNIESVNTVQPEQDQDELYSNDRIQLTEQLPKSFTAYPNRQGLQNVLLTGATGFLGAHILALLCQSEDRIGKIFVHVRAKNAEAGLSRIQNTFTAYGLQMNDRVVCVPGDLAAPKLGLDTSVWQALSNDVDVIIHNGAHVHWVLEYSALRAANVLSTVELIELCSLSKAKTLVFVSSTAVLDTAHYLNPNNIPTGGLPEADQLTESAKGLPTGYGQSKWVAEALLRDAGERGLQGTIIRPGYVTGDTKGGTTITDDFLVRILKGCVQLGAYPDLGDDNFINMMPVDGVAQLCVAAALHQKPGMPLLNTVNRTLTFNQYLSTLSKVGYVLEGVDYDTWRTKLQDYVTKTADQKYEEHALLPLYHLAVSDLPQDSRSPVLNIDNTNYLIKASSLAASMPQLDETTLARYLGYLVAIGFMQAPAGEILPPVELSAERRAALAKVEGRGKI